MKQEEMNLSSILFSGVAILVCMNSFVTMERVATCDINEHWTATMRAMKRCNSNIKNYYNEHEDQPLRYRYCKGMKVLMKCAEDVTARFEDTFNCTSEVLQKWVFVSLQYILISKKERICNYNTTLLRRLVARLGFDNDDRYKNLSIARVVIPGNLLSCAKAIHQKCALKLVSTSENLCKGVQDFVECYHNAVVSFPPPNIVVCNFPPGLAVPEISKKFEDLIHNFSNQLINGYELNAGEMCNVDESEIEHSYEH